VTVFREVHLDQLFVWSWCSASDRHDVPSTASAVG
jgi:hypothetical protein